MAMKKLIIILLMIVSTSCRNVSSNSRYTTVKIDGCEYLQYEHPWYFTHKGNCSNPVHRCQR